MNNEERRAWLSRPPREALARTLGRVAWVLTAAVLLLVGLMRRPELHLTLPEGWSLSFLPPVHAALNTGVAVALLVALAAVKRGNLRAHQRAMTTALSLSVLFLLCYVAYHFTTHETRYGGTGLWRTIYLVLLLSHIALAALSFPAILFTFIASWTNRFAQHRRLARWVFPVWLYVAVTGPVCYLMLRPYYA